MRNFISSASRYKSRSEPGGRSSQHGAARSPAPPSLCVPVAAGAAASPPVAAPGTDRRRRTTQAPPGRRRPSAAEQRLENLVVFVVAVAAVRRRPVAETVAETVATTDCDARAARRQPITTGGRAVSISGVRELAFADVDRGRRGRRRRALVAGADKTVRQRRHHLDPVQKKVKVAHTRLPSVGFRS